MKTVIKSYSFDISIKSDADQWRELCARMNGAGAKLHETIAANSHYLEWAKDGLEIELDTGHIFGNQWNTAPIPGLSENGYRVFEWALDACIPNKNIKRGHYLEITSEMREIQRNTLTCGYCGHQEPAQKGNIFCTKCAGSEYLAPDNYKLLRLLPAAITFGGDRPELSEAERAHLLPIIEEAQKQAHEKRAEKLREAIKRDCDKKIDAALIERDGKLWLLDHGQSVDNWIYYRHTGRWCYGWLEPVREVPAIVCEFPFNFDIKRAS